MRCDARAMTRDGVMIVLCALTRGRVDWRFARCGVGDVSCVISRIDSRRVLTRVGVAQREARG